MAELKKVKIFICDMSYGTNVLRALSDFFGNTVSVELSENGGLQVKSNMYDAVFISGQDFLVKKNTIENFRKQFCAPNHVMIIISSSMDHLTLCNSQNVFCVNRNKIFKLSKFPEMQDFLIKVANRESVIGHDALWKGPSIDPVNLWKKDQRPVRYRKKTRRIVMLISMFCIINLFLLVTFPDKYIAFMLSIFHFVKSIL